MAIIIDFQWRVHALLGYGLNSCVPLKLICWILTPKVMVLEGVDPSGDDEVPKVKPPWMKWMPLHKRLWRALRPSPLCEEYNEKSVIRRGPWHVPAATLVLDVHPLEQWDIDFCCLQATQFVALCYTEPGQTKADYLCVLMKSCYFFRLFTKNWIKNYF